MSFDMREPVSYALRNPQTVYENNFPTGSKWATSVKPSIIRDHQKSMYESKTRSFMK